MLFINISFAVSHNQACYVFLQTLVLDGIKLSGAAGLGELLGSLKGLAALSLAGCQLTDTDLQPLFSALSKGLPLHMLKLSANRLQDDSVTALVAGLMKHKTHPLGLLDMSNNKVGHIPLSMCLFVYIYYALTKQKNSHI